MTRSPVKKIATVLGAGSLLLGGAVLAPAASAATPVATSTTTSTAPAAVVPDAGTRTSLVAAWYQQFLGRAPDAGAKYWVVRLRTEAPAVVLADLLRTREAAIKQVDDLYKALLRRNIVGDPGAEYWISGIVSGAFPAEWAEQNILASDEYALRQVSPSNDGADLATPQWYLDVLGRQASQGELDYWLSVSASPLQKLRAIWYSPEAVNLRVASHYRDYLQRSANSGEIAYWFDAEVSSDIGVVIAIASSAEYQANSPTFLS